MIVDRRMTLAALLGGSVIGVLPARAALLHADPIVVVDTRLIATRAFLKRQAASQVIDLAGTHGDPWRELRSLDPSGARIAGLTRWSDWIAIRGALLEKRLRVRSETRIDAPASGVAGLFVWSMA